MPLVLPNGIRITLHGEWTNARPILSVWHAIVTTSIGRNVACQDATGAVASFWADDVVPLLLDNYSISKASWVDLATEDGSTGDIALTTPGVGAVASQGMPPSSGVVVTKTIADGGRGRRSGRIFIPSGQEASADEDGVITALAQANAEQALTAFMVDCNAYTSPNVNSLHLVVAHIPHVAKEITKTIKVPATEGLMSASTITGFVSNATVSGIRRRVAG